MSDLQADLDLTLSTLQQDLSAVSANKALRIIETWQTHFQGHTLANDLEKLKHAISMGNQQQVGEILVAVGKDTTSEAASSADDVSVKVQQLGDLLGQVGSSLK